MARQPRPDLPYYPQHVVQRGNDRMACFRDDFDREMFLDFLARAAERYDCAIHAHVLMTNHVHLLVTPNRRRALSLMMQSLGARYVMAFNRRHLRTGTLWEGRYRSCLVDNDRYALACSRYIELNPVRAGLVASPADFRWSSYSANALGAHAGFLIPHSAYLELGLADETRRAAYRALFADALTEDQLAAIRDATRCQLAFGSARFLAMLGQVLGRSFDSVPGPQRPSRPSSASIVASSPPPTSTRSPTTGSTFTPQPESRL
ncbi:MAG TPA: transposase [Xanthomonadales bacterium]|nr:transposase [Xanthomonadales bacterium]